MHILGGAQGFGEQIVELRATCARGFGRAPGLAHLVIDFALTGLGRIKARGHQEQMLGRAFARPGPEHLTHIAPGQNIAEHIAERVAAILHCEGIVAGQNKFDAVTCADIGEFWHAKAGREAAQALFDLALRPGETPKPLDSGRFIRGANERELFHRGEIA